MKVSIRNPSARADWLNNHSIIKDDDTNHYINIVINDWFYYIIHYICDSIYYKIMFKRNILRELHKWSQRPDRKPLVLRGARQVGKTTVVQEFAKSYEVFLKLNLEKEGDRNLFEVAYPMDDLMMAIYLANKQVRSNKSTLLFIDEIQNSPKAVAMMRYFHEEIPDLHVIAAGSLLESLIDRQLSFPVGRVEYLPLRPCSFTEFLGAMGETEMLGMLEAISLPEILHDKMMRLFNLYSLIGGMPEVVANFAENRDMVLLQRVFKSLLLGYRDDVEKYARNSTMQLSMRHILHAGFAYSGQRIKFERFANSGYRSREMGEAFRTLEKAMLLELVYPSTGYSAPILPDLKKSPRLLWFDTGLVNYCNGIQKEISGPDYISDQWRGTVAEHIVSQELLAADLKVSAKRSFWVRESKNSNAEVDFLVLHQNLIIPVEVKSGDSARLRSLHLFMDGVSHQTGIRFWAKPMQTDLVKTFEGKEFNLISLPFYLAGLLDKVLADDPSEDLLPVAGDEHGVNPGLFVSCCKISKSCRMEISF